MMVERTDAPHWSRLLRHERVQRNWRQQDLAERLGTTRLTIHRWEQGHQQPGPYYRIKLGELFGKSAQEFGLLPEVVNSQATQEREADTPVEIGSLSSDIPDRCLWGVPYLRNPFFIGREDTLKSLHARLSAELALALTQSHALSGLGGIGKSQLAIEYAYRYAQNYTAVFWIAAETRESIVSSLLQIADLLQLPERKGEDQQQIIAAVQHWLSLHTGWLLIWDNLEDLELFTHFLPPTRQGVILITTRCQALGTLALGIEVQTMEPEEGLLLLLRRSKVLGRDATSKQIHQLAVSRPSEYAAARNIVTIMDGLPLSLDQAGAYVEETGCSLSDYLSFFQRRRAELLQRRGRAVGHHPEPVSTTWLLSFERVEQENKAAADLLRLCAFLSPDAIPEEILTQGAIHLGAHLGPVAADPFALNEAIGVLFAYSLIQRQANESTLSIHRLVQVVLRDSMDQAEIHLWANRAVEVVNHSFPNVEELTTWQRCQHLLPQALICAQLIEQEGVVSLAAGRLVHETSTYLLETARYELAEHCITLALRIRRHMLGENHPTVAYSLNHLAELYYYRGQYQQAEHYHQQALTIRQNLLEPEHCEVAASLNNLAAAYLMQGRYAEAEPIYQQTLQLREQIYGPEHLDVAESLQNLAYLYVRQERYTLAEPLYQRCLSICQQQLPRDHGYFTTILNNLGQVFLLQGHLEQAGSFFQSALMICQLRFAPTHPRLALTYTNLGELAYARGDDIQAEHFYQQALQIVEESLGPQHPRVAQNLYNLARLYSTQGRSLQAQKLLERALAIGEKVLGPDHPDVLAMQKLSTLLLLDVPL